MTIIFRSPKSDEEFASYFEFRWQQLRKPLGFERGSEQDELEDSAFHIAAFNKKEVVGVGRIQIENNHTSRIRYMAVDSNFKNQGIGSGILEQLEAIARANKVSLCWLLARENAVAFYLKNKYEIKGIAKSELPIPHLRMQKEL